MANLILRRLFVIPWEFSRKISRIVHGVIYIIILAYCNNTGYRVAGQLNVMVCEISRWNIVISKTSPCNMCTFAYIIPPPLLLLPRNSPENVAVTQKSILILKVLSFGGEPQWKEVSDDCLWTEYTKLNIYFWSHRYSV